MGKGQVRPVLLERPLRIVGRSWGRLRFGLVQRAVVPRTGFGLEAKGRGAGRGGGEAAARSEPMLVRACFHAADGCDAPSLRKRRMAETRWRSACRDRC